MYLAIHIATKASEPVKQCRMQSKHSDESFSDDQEITSKSLSEISNDSVDDKNLNKSIKGIAIYSAAAYKLATAVILDGFRRTIYEL